MKKLKYFIIINNVFLYIILDNININTLYKNNIVKMLK